MVPVHSLLLSSISMYTLSCLAHTAKHFTQTSLVPYVSRSSMHCMLLLRRNYGWSEDRVTLCHQWGATWRPCILRQCLALPPLALILFRYETYQPLQPSG